MSKAPRDMTSAPDLRAHHGTGAARTEIPVYVDRLPPCNIACPAGENIQGWLSHLREGRHREAWDVLVRDNPFPAIHGRVCYHRCEDACNRRQLDTTVSIHASERFLGDLALERRFLFTPGASTGRRVLVVGAGPSGLAATYHLRRAGHSVTLVDAGRMAGGMMHFGIPRYRLPRDILDGEIQRVVAMGVELRLEHKVEDLEAEMADHDATFLAVGAHLSRRVDIPAMDASRLLDAVEFLRAVEDGERPLVGRRVAVYGGGNTAIDAARTAQRLGATETLIVYRRTRERAPAHDWEIGDAAEEGVKLHWLRTVKEVHDGNLTVEKMALDGEGWPQPTGETETLPADTLILALGQSTDTAFLDGVAGVARKPNGTVEVDDQLMTGRRGLFAGGDMVPDERSVTVAVGHGKRAARAIDAFLRGEQYAPAPKAETATFDKLHVWLHTDAPQREEDVAAPETRVQDFSEVVTGLTEEQAVYEAQRCLSCGNCFECDACYGACPEKAVIKLGKGLRYRFDLELCTGCRTCFEQCPCGAIRMEADPS